MRKQLFKTWAKLNRILLPSLTKRRIPLEEASKLQLAIFAYRLWVVMRALD